MKRRYTDTEFDVLVKLDGRQKLTLKDHFTLGRIYKRHGAMSVCAAMRNMDGLPHINKRLAAKRDAARSRKV
jgi:hypothetical protein